MEAMNLPSHMNSLADFYFGFLKGLNANSKLELIVKLSESLKKSDESPQISLESLFGSYNTDESADEIIAQIRDSRVFNRDIEAL